MCCMSATIDCRDWEILLNQTCSLFCDATDGKFIDRDLNRIFM